MYALRGDTDSAGAMKTQRRDVYLVLGHTHLGCSVPVLAHITRAAAHRVARDLNKVRIHPIFKYTVHKIPLHHRGKV